MPAADAAVKAAPANKTGNATAPVTAVKEQEEMPTHHWGADVKYSDQLSNGDVDDDKEVEDEDDPRDHIVDDNGFVNQTPRAVSAEWSTKLQTKDEGNNYEESPPTWGADVKYSDQLANGDKDDDKQVEDEDDVNDDITDDNGFTNQFKGNGNLAQKQ